MNPMQTEWVPFLDLTSADSEYICETIMRGEYSYDRDIVFPLKSPILESPRVVRLSPHAMIVLLRERLKTAGAAFFRIKCGYGNTPSVERMTWTELGEAAKGSIHMEAEYKRQLAASKDDHG